MTFTSVHPRVCGEQIKFRIRLCPEVGSSPRVRGTGAKAESLGFLQRFIPACAGNRTNRLLLRLLVAVHPRVCGEQILFACARPVLSGSSPRVRGTAKSGASQPHSQRFIPACAGNSGGNQVLSNANAVHPRVCGEQTGVSCYYCFYRGSSPRVRGTVYSTHRRAGQHRFIPACAGNSSMLLFS